MEAGFTRFRPVLMTALAMIIGMAPMALGLGEGGEQNAPLGRAVIGGLIFATIATLMFVPVVFSLAPRQGQDRARPDPFAGEPAYVLLITRSVAGAERRPSTRTLKIAGVAALCVAGLVVVAGARHPRRPRPAS